ncbi:C40 family peptidase [Candidatus Fermentibacteria bacterium]|nr:C40 family peptidase [Candidatus Fermentibacteria bacterium]
MKPSMLLKCAVVFATLLAAAEARAGSTAVPGDSVQASRIVEDALSWLGVPYVYGGTGPEGFDCSGFIFRVFSDNGIALPRTAGEMRAVGAGIGIEDLLPGDLVFFDNPGHVGLYLGEGEFIHSSSYQGRGVVVTRLDQPNYARRYACSRRVVPASSEDPGCPETAVDTARGLTPGPE